MSKKNLGEFNNKAPQAILISVSVLVPLSTYKSSYSIDAFIKQSLNYYFECPFGSN